MTSLNKKQFMSNDDKNLDKIKSFYQIENSHPEIWKKYFLNCQLWKVSRDVIYKKFTRDSNHSNPIAKTYKKNIGSVFFNLRKVDCLIIENPRKINFKGIHIDPYTENVINDLSSKNKKLLLINNGNNNGLYQLNSKYQSYTSNWDFLDSLIRKLINIILKKSKVCKTYISLINKIFRNEFNKDLLFCISNYFLDFLKFSIIFKFTMPQEIYIVCSYGKEGLIQAAKNKNIKVIEMQHGVLGNFHPGYSFGEIKPDHFPDEIMLFGKYWKDSTNFPISKLNFYKRYEMSKKSSKELISNLTNSVIVVSQQSIRTKLIAATKSLARHNPSFNFIFKLHPKEFDEINTIKKEFINFRNVLISSNPDSISMIKNSIFIVASHSSFIFEALTEYKPVFLIPDASNIFFNNLIEKKYVRILDSMKINLRSLNEFNLDYEEDYFF